MSANLWTAVFAVALVASLLTRGWLAARQARHVLGHRDAVPTQFQATVEPAAHRKAADYTLAKIRLGQAQMIFAAVVLLGWTLFGGLDMLNTVVRNAVGMRWDGLIYEVALVAAFLAISGLLELPFDLYATFGLEARFGFNRTTWRLWLADALKGLLLAIVIGVPLLGLVLWIMAASGPLWWLWAWLTWAAFNLIALVVFPTLIAPLFNRFEPLADASLEARIRALMARAGFAAKGLFVMDGSRRSAHGNAYFTGFGAARRVVFFDTLLARLAPVEVEAVLAHELGHFKLGHVARRITAMFAASLVLFAVFGWLAARNWFYAGLGVAPTFDGPDGGLALLLLILVAPVFGFFVAPLFARLSRRHEFEADAWAAAQADGNALASALLKLHEDNASTLTPDPVYARFYYSHPPAVERLARLTASLSASATS
ncbi:MAG: M48 family metallopeptidase [Pseudomonadota bacterium]|nr:M48 family metallopeptidase [Pseudomonadota bacterium]